MSSLLIALIALVALVAIAAMILAYPTIGRTVEENLCWSKYPLTKP